jgi:hypothetical protein
VLVGQWKKEILEQAGTLFEGKRGPKPQETHESEDRLYGEIGRLKLELDWLKKKKSPGYKRSREDGVDRARRRHCVVAPMRAGRRSTGKCVSSDRRARGNLYSGAKQYMRPAPPVPRSASWLHPRDACDEFHDRDAGG